MDADAGEDKLEGKSDVSTRQAATERSNMSCLCDTVIIRDESSAICATETT